MAPRIVAVAVASFALLASQALAQGTSVGVSLTGDIFRVGSSETRGVSGPDASGSGEALGFALRLDTPVGENWGVELEFARSGRVDSEVTPAWFALMAVSGVANALNSSIDATTAIYPSISYRARIERRETTVAAGAFARHDLTPRFALVYSGGVAFHRTEVGTALTFEPGPLPLLPLGRPIIVPPPFITDTTVYGSHPFVGLSGRIQMTDHVRLLPGIRLHGLDGGVLVRPSVGLAWVF